MSVNQFFQTTLAKSISRSGIGIHSARLVDITIKPAEANTGIVFRRNDISSVETNIKAVSANIADTMLNSQIMNDDGVSVATIEHLMAAFSGLGIDNAIVEVNAAELPAMDGSAEIYCTMLKEAKITTLNSRRKYLKVLKEISITNGASTASISPADALEIDVTIDFDDPIIGKSQYFYIHTESSFEAELAAARTFCNYSDLTKMRATGYALGGSLDNAVVVDNGTILNKEGLRFTDEFVRHKTLDCIGDLALAGYPILGHVNCIRPGHAVNNMLLEALLADETAWAIITPEAPTAPQRQNPQKQDNAAAPAYA